MNRLVQLFQWAKTLHRLSMFGMVGLGLIMGLTGSLLKFEVISSVIPVFDLQLVRYLHNELSPFFSLFFGVMSLTGIYMYWFPWYSKRQAAKKMQP